MSSSTPSSPRSALGRFLAGFFAFVAPFAAMIGAAALESSSQGDTITTAELIGAVVAAVVAAAAVDARQVGSSGPEDQA